MQGLFALLVYLIILCIMCTIAYYAITRLLPEPMQRVALVILFLIAGIIACFFLLSLAGGGGSISLPRIHN